MTKKEDKRRSVGKVGTSNVINIEFSKYLARTREKQIDGYTSDKMCSDINVSEVLVEPVLNIFIFWSTDTKLLLITKRIIRIVGV